MFAYFVVVWYNGPESVHETNQFTITCNSSLFANIKWRKSGPITDLESKDFFLTDGGRFSNITIKYALPSHSGNYKCSYEFDDYGHNLTVIVGKDCGVSFCMMCLTRKLDLIVCA